MKKILVITLAFVCVFISACSSPAGDISSEISIPCPETSVPSVPVYDISRVYIETDTDIVREEYRACSIRIVDKYGNEFSDTYCKIKIRGNSTSSGEKKPYNIKLSESANVLGLGNGKKWCLLANCYEKTLIRNEMVFDFARRTALSYTPDSIFTDVYLNGILLGNYLLCESVGTGTERVDIDTYNNEFLLERDVREDEGTVYIYSPVLNIRFGINAPEYPSEQQLDWLYVFLEKAENALVSGNFENIKKYFDIDSVTDFYIILEYFKQADVSVGSTRFYIKDGRIYGGPVWDFDLTMGNCLDTYYQAYNNYYGSGNSWEGLYCSVDWFEYLNRCAEFCDIRNQRYLQLQENIVNLYAAASSGDSYIDRTISEYGSSFLRNYSDAGWIVDKVYSTLERVPDKTYGDNIEYLRNWLEKRNHWLIQEWHLSAQAYVIPRSDSGIKRSGVYFCGLPAQTSPEECKAMFINDISVFSEHEYVGTGSTVKNRGFAYMFVVAGDITGDGIIDSEDCSLLQKAVNGNIALENAFFRAADINGDGVLTDEDYTLICNMSS